MVRLRILRGVPLYAAGGSDAAGGGGGAAGAEPESDGHRAACGGGHCSSNGATYSERDSTCRRVRHPAAQSVSAEARAFFDQVLCRDYVVRCTAAQALRQQWLEVQSQEPSVEQPWAPF